MPPLRLARSGCPLVGSRTKPGIVLMAQSASAPACTTAWAMRPTLGTFGASLTISGILWSATACFTHWVTAAADSALAANGSPKLSSTFGQEMLTSMQSGRARAMRRATSPNSAAVPAKMLAMTRTPRGCSLALASCNSRASSSTPGLASPIALRRPPPQSMQEGLTWPLRGVGPQLLAVTAPQPPAAARSNRLTVVPQMPLARTRGEASSKSRKETGRLG